MRLLALALVLAARVACAAVSVVDDAGNDVTLARPAQRIVSLAPHATDWDVEFETHHTLCCDHTDCLKWAAQWSDDGASVHLDSYPLRSRAEAEAISGLDLSEVTR